MCVRAVRKASTAPRVLLNARWIDASAVRFAWMDVTPKVMPNTTTTSNAEATKTFAKRPNAGLIALVPGVRGILFAVLVLVSPPLVAARIERQLQVTRSGGLVFLPDKVSFAAYQAILSGGVVTRATLVSLGVTVVGTAACWNPPRLAP